MIDSDKLADDIDKAFAKEGITLIKTSSTDYQEVNLVLLEELIKKRGLPGVYVTVNKPYDVIEEMLDDRGIDTSDLFFIDAVSKDLNREISEGRNDVVFLDSPQQLTDLSIIMDQVVTGMEKGEKFVFFDSMTMLALYNNVNTVEKFAHRFLNKMRTWNVAGVLVSVEEEMNSELVSHLTQFTDHLIEV